MTPTFEWDPEKARANVRKHWVSFEEAETAFGDYQYVAWRDERSIDEDRFIMIGLSGRGRLLTVAYTFRDEDAIRIISARNVTPRERRNYEQENEPD